MATYGGPPQWKAQNGIWTMSPRTFFPPTNAVAGGGVSTNLATAQSFNTIAANSGFIDLDGTSAVKLTTNRNAVLAVPVSIFFHFSAVGSTGNLLIDGTDQFGVRGIETLAYNSTTSTVWGTVKCYKIVHSVTVAPLVTAAGADTISTGWKLSNNTSAFPNRYPVPFRLKASTHVVGVIPMDDGVSNVASIVTGIGRTITTVDINNNTLAFASGAITDQPTEFMEFAILMAPGTENLYL